jgi:hypothetical protein
MLLLPPALCVAILHSFSRSSDGEPDRQERNARFALLAENQNIIERLSVRRMLQQAVRRRHCVRLWDAQALDTRAWIWNAEPMAFALLVDPPAIVGKLADS